MEDGPHAVVAREPEGRIAERVEERQDAEQPVGRPDAEDLRDRLDVGVDVEVREDHPLRLARAPAAEDDRRRVVHRGPASPPPRAAPGAGSARARPSPTARSRSARPIPAPMSSSQMGSTPPGSSSLAFSRKVRLVTTVRSPACRAADSIPALPDVKLRLTAARPAIAAARFTRAAATLDGSRMPTFGWSPQCGRRARASATAPASAPIPETRGRCEVGEGQPGGVPACPTDEPVMQRPAIGLAVGPGLLVEVVDRLPNRVERRLGRERDAERDRHRQGNPLGERAGMHRAEEARRGAVQVDGDDRRRPALDDPLQPALERLDHAGAGDLPLGEDADQLSRHRVPGPPRGRPGGSASARRRRRSGSPASPGAVGPGSGDGSSRRRRRTAPDGRCWRRGTGRRRTRRGWESAMRRPPSARSSGRRP